MDDISPPAAYKVSRNKITPLFIVQIAVAEML